MKKFLTLAAFLETVKGFANGMEDEKFKALDAEAKAEIFNELNKHNSEVINEMAKNDEQSKEEIAKMREDLQNDRIEQMKLINETLKEFGLQIKKLSEKEKAEKGNVPNLRDALKGLAESSNNNPSKLELIKSGEVQGMTTVTKAVGDMTITGNVSGGNVPVEQRIPGLNTVASRRVRLMDLVTSGRASSNLISWVYQSGQEGSAGGTTEGSSKNQIDFDLVVASQSVVKRTAYIKVSTEMLDDIDFIESSIRNELMRELMKDVEDTAYDGNGTAPNMNGVYTTATAFAAGTFAASIDNANEVDVLTVAANQIKIAEQGMPDAILMHPSDVTSLKMVKVSSTDKRYVERLAMVAGQLSLDGVPIIETTLVTQGTYLIGDFGLATLFQKDGISIMMGLDGNDLTKNMRTIIAEFRGCMVVKNNDRTAFVKGTFATDKAALETT